MCKFGDVNVEICSCEDMEMSRCGDMSMWRFGVIDTANLCFWLVEVYKTKTFLS